jgi:hypothetical protein
MKTPLCWQGRFLMLSDPLVQIRGLLMPSEYTSLPWIRDAVVVTDGEDFYVKLRVKDSDEVIVVLTSEFHRWAHRAMDHSIDVERQEQDLEADLAESSVDEIGSAL